MVDARGQSCPIPVVMTKKALKANPEGVTVQVDNECAKENITRYASNNGYTVDVAAEGNTFTLTLKK